MHHYIISSWVSVNIGELSTCASGANSHAYPSDCNRHKCYCFWVVVSGLRSRNGSAFRLLELVGSEQFQINLSVPLVLEYEEVLLRERSNLSINASDVQDFLDFHCAIATHHQIFFLWRPFLSDPKDDMVLELAVKAGCDSVVTYNVRDFANIEQFGVNAITPAKFLEFIGVLS